MKAQFYFCIDVDKADRRVHILRTAMKLPLNIQAVFAFFGDASNLERITPPELHFHITSPQPIKMAEGTRIDYRLRLFGVPFRWQTRISSWDPPLCFVDQQIQGPYRQWVHTHRFNEKYGQTTIRDEVDYRLPFWPVGEIVQPLVAAQLKRIFHYRKLAIEKSLLGLPVDKIR